MRYDFCGQQFSINAMTNGGGSVVERYAYSAYGTPTITDGSGVVQTVSSEGNRYLHTGREWDESLSLHHYRARMYDSESGRFVSQDPISFAAGDANLYRYVGNSPTNKTDPSGLRDPDSDAPWPAGPRSPTDGTRESWDGYYRFKYGPIAEEENNLTFLLDYLHGTGATYRKYPSDSPVLADMIDSPGVKRFRDKFYANGCASFTNFSYGHFEAVWETGPFSPSRLTQVEFQVGGFAGASAVNNGDETVTFKIRNVAGRRSFRAGLFNRSKGPEVKDWS